MARRKTIGVKKILASAIPRSTLTQLANEVGLVQRVRKVDVHAFFWTLVLGFGTGRERTLAGLRRAYKFATGVRLVPSAFYDRFTPALAKLLKLVVGRLLGEAVGAKGQLSGLLGGFRDLILTDSTVIRLHDLLEKAFPACRTNHTLAALKMHAVISVNAAGPRSVKITSERVHDGPVFRVGKWIKDRLLIFDLAYFKFQRFSCIRRNGGYFIVRLKKSADPVIVAANQKWRGASVPLLGRRVSEVVERLQRRAIDVEVELTFKRRVYGGVRHKDRERFRLVGVRDPVTGDYHLYLTNIPPKRLSPEEIAQAYAARWLIEPFFRQLKASYRLEDMPSRKRAIVEALLYASLVTFVVSGAVLAAVRKKLGALGARVPDERWATVFATAARDVLKVVVRRSAESVLLARETEAGLLDEAVDPNVSRALLRQRVESGIQYRHRISVGKAHA
jgi:putative transposase